MSVIFSRLALPLFKTDKPELAAIARRTLQPRVADRVVARGGTVFAILTAVGLESTP
jgi:hypothetical protein